MEKKKKLVVSLHFTPKDQDVKKLVGEFETALKKYIYHLPKDAKIELHHCFLPEEEVIENDFDNSIHEAFHDLYDHIEMEQNGWNPGLEKSGELDFYQEHMFDYIEQNDGISVFLGEIKGGVETELRMAIKRDIPVFMIDENSGELNKQHFVKKSIGVKELAKLIRERNLSESEFRSFAENIAKDLGGDIEKLTDLLYRPTVDQFNQIFVEVFNESRKTVKIKIIVKEGGELPVYATSQSSGADIKAAEDFSLEPGERRMIHTGLYMQLPENVEVQCRPRSGLALKKGITCLNAPGTIDADYRGECNVILINHGSEKVFFEKGERIAQFVFVENVVKADFELVNEFDDVTERGDGGFGHTGMK